MKKLGVGHGIYGDVALSSKMKVDYLWMLQRLSDWKGPLYLRFIDFYYRLEPGLNSREPGQFNSVVELG